MATWSQSHFLQSLGWTTLNSFWQMAVLWCVYLLATSLFKLNAQQKYQWAAASLICGFLWSIFTFVLFYQDRSVTLIPRLEEINSLGWQWQPLLIAASTSYLLLLVFPSYKFFKNWRFVKRAQTDGLQKADINCRLFVQKISSRLGITRQVRVYLSTLVHAPMTLGYLKPIILLPVAAMNQLSLPQVEAVLLHELSHIRRYDYLVNFIVSLVQTLFYFNPFVKKLMQAVEAERENCCDELVLQFGYDKISYAASLLTLQKISSKCQELTIAATGKSSLLTRIEKITGMEQKNGFRFRQMAGVLAALFCIVAFNSVLIIKEKETKEAPGLTYTALSNPLLLFAPAETGMNQGKPTPQKSPSPLRLQVTPQQTTVSINEEVKEVTVQETVVEPIKAAPDAYKFVAADDVDAALSIEEKEHVASTIDATKKVMTTLQWKEIEGQLADVMTKNEKIAARQQYDSAVANLNWQHVEQNLKTQYDKLNWKNIDQNISNALTAIQLDSLQDHYTSVLELLQDAIQAYPVAAPVVSPLPDVSVQDMEKAVAALKARISKIQALRSERKVIRL